MTDTPTTEYLVKILFSVQDTSYEAAEARVLELLERQFERKKDTQT
jgi:hypothetical protein